MAQQYGAQALHLPRCLHILPWLVGLWVQSQQALLLEGKPACCLRRWATPADVTEPGREVTGQQEGSRWTSVLPKWNEALRGREFCTWFHFGALNWVANWSMNQLKVFVIFSGSFMFISSDVLGLWSLRKAGHMFQVISADLSLDTPWGFKLLALALQPGAPSHWATTGQNELLERSN